MANPVLDMYGDPAEIQPGGDTNWFGWNRQPQGQPAPYLTSLRTVGGEHPGILEPGNMDLTNRPDVDNGDGTHSSVRSMSSEDNGQEVLFPTVGDEGRVLSDEQAWQRYKQTGHHLGKFKDVKSANAYAQALHLQQEGAPVGGAFGPQRLDRRRYEDLVQAMLGAK